MIFTKKRTIACLLFIIYTVLLSCKNTPAETTEEAGHEHEEHDEHAGDEDIVTLTAPQRQTAAITIGRVEQRALSGSIRVNGMLDAPPQNLVSISAPLGGFLRSTEMLQGKYVRKGEAVAVMENTEYIQLQQDFLDYRSQLEFLEGDFHRQEELSAENVNARKSLQQARAVYHSMQARVNGLKAKLRMININPDRLAETQEIKPGIVLYSPISGYVTKVNVNIGMFVNTTDVMFRIVDTKHLHAELTVFEKDVPRLKIGQKVRFMLANEINERMATVYLIGREIDEDRTVRIHCHLDQEDTELLPGMYLTAWVEAGSHAVPSLPESAIVDFEERKYIFIEQPGKGEQGGGSFKRVAVETGVSEQGFVEVTLPGTYTKEQTPVVIVGAYDLLSKMMNREEEGGHSH